MTAVKCKQEYKTLLDFRNTKRKVSKNLVKQSLRQVEMPSYRNSGDEVIHTNYEINVGIYQIRLLFNHDNSIARTKLREYGLFYIEITEIFQDRQLRKLIWTDSDIRFKTQYWSDWQRGLNINDLVNVIMYCNRLSKLKAFL